MTNAFQLLGVSLLTLLTLVLTFLLHLCHVLSPLFNLILNLPLLLLWCLGFGLLTWNMSGTLGHVCNTANWGNSSGIMICRYYKALFSFSLFGVLGAIAAFILDFKVRRKQTRFGAYDQMKDPSTTNLPQGGDAKMRGLGVHSTSIGLEPYRNEGHEPDTWRPPPYNAPRENVNIQHFYSAPSEQTAYDGGYGYSDRR